MKTRFQVIEGGVTTLDTVMESRNRYSAMHTLLTNYQLPYNPSFLQERGDWLNYYRGDDRLFRVSTKFG